MNAIPTALAAIPTGPALVAAMALVPLAAAYWLLTRSHGRPIVPALTRVDRPLAAVRNELQSNYEKLRHAGQAVPLAIDAWQRLAARADELPPAARRQLAQTYHAVDVANRLLATSAAYDRRGHLSLKHRQIALWPTIEAALRSALAALDVTVTPAARTRLRLTTPAAPAMPVAARRSFNLDEAPRLALVADSVDATAAAPVPATRRPRPTAVQRGKRRRPAARDCEGQMPLWGVA